jgi:hypothetical protein
MRAPSDQEEEYGCDESAADDTLKARIDRVDVFAARAHNEVGFATQHSAAGTAESADN